MPDENRIGSDPEFTEHCTMALPQRCQLSSPRSTSDVQSSEIISEIVSLLWRVCFCTIHDFLCRDSTVLAWRTCRHYFHLSVASYAAYTPLKCP